MYHGYEIPNISIRDCKMFVIMFRFLDVKKSLAHSILGNKNYNILNSNNWCWFLCYFNNIEGKKKFVGTGCST